VIDYSFFGRSNLITSRNAERQKVVPPPAPWCHSVPEWRSSPSRIRHNRRILRENTKVGRKVAQKAAHSEGAGSPQEAAGCRTQPEVWAVSGKRGGRRTRRTVPLNGVLLGLF
jgi:hypothetical protein